MISQDEIEVLHLIGSLSAGGAERNLYYLAPQLARSNFRYGICCLTQKGEFAPEVERLGIRVYELGYRRRYAVRTVFRLWRLLRDKRVKIIHTHLFLSGVVGRLAAWLARVPIIITHEHGKTTWKRWYHIWFERFATHFTDLRIAVSQDILDLRLKHERTPPSKITVIHNTVDPAHFEITEDARRRKRAELGLERYFVIGTVGRLVKAKSYDLMLEVAHEICREGDETRFILVGHGPLAATLRQIRDSYDLADRVHFLGKRTDIPEVMAAIDLYLITSQREGLPIALIEAMMAAKPIVATAVGGIPETLDHDKDGVLVEPGNRSALAEAVSNLRRDPEKMRRLGESARKKAIQRYSPNVVVEAIEKTYARIMVEKGVSLGVDGGDCPESTWVSRR